MYFFSIPLGVHSTDFTIFIPGDRSCGLNDTTAYLYAYKAMTTYYENLKLE